MCIDALDKNTLPIHLAGLQNLNWTVLCPGVNIFMNFVPFSLNTRLNNEGGIFFGYEINSLPPVTGLSGGHFVSGVYCFAKSKNIFTKHNLDTLSGHKIAEIIPKMKEGDKNTFLFFFIYYFCVLIT